MILFENQYKLFFVVSACFVPFVFQWCRAQEF